MQPPTGKVTLVFTDIEGSTSLWERHRDQFKPVLEQHNALMRDAATRQGGYEVKTEGDAFFLAFPAALPAVRFALDAQSRLESLKAGSDPVRVRIGIHTGEPLVEIDRQGRADYFGPAVNRAARVAAAGHGGQTLLSRAAWHAVSGLLDPELETVALGELRLRGIEEPEGVYQLLAPGAPRREFPPLRGIAESPTNLPSQTTTFLGRGRELRALRALLTGESRRNTDSVKPLETLTREPGVPDTGVITRGALGRDRGARLITLTGPGGCGKTRLAVALGTEVLGSFRDGVWFADLSAVTDEAGLCVAVASALRIELPAGKGSAADRLGWALEQREALLVLDTFEHLSTHAGTLLRWLRAAPRLKMVVTSRELLRLEGEVEFNVSPLPLPSLEGLRPGTGRLPGKISDSPAVQLFLERAAQARPGFALTPKNAAAIAEIVNRVDGIPLALELAAARLRGMTPEQLAERLRGGIELLATRDRGHGNRQAALTDTIAWSFGLLDAWERAALLQLSVFEGPFTLESAEAVLILDQPLEAMGGENPPPETMDLVFGLRDKSLLSLKSDDDRYLMEMLGTIRAFAAPRLVQAATKDLLHELSLRHARHFLARAEALAELLASPMGQSLKEADAWGIADTQAAARWALEHQRLDLGLALCNAAGRVLHARSRFSEMQALMQAAVRAVASAGGAESCLSDPGVKPHLARAFALAALSEQRQFHQAGAVELANQGIDVARRTGQGDVEADCLNVIGIFQFYRREFEDARATFERALELNRARKDERGVAASLSNIAMTQMGGDYEAMRRLAQEAHSIYVRLGDRRGQARTANTLGVAYEWLSDFDRARELYQDSIRLKLQLRDDAGAANSRANLASMDFRRLDFDAALEQFEQLLEPMRQGGDKSNLALSLESASVICTALERPEKGLDYAQRAVALRREAGDQGGLLDALSARAGAQHMLRQQLDAEATCDEMVELADKMQRPQDRVFARLRCALCGRPRDRAAHLRAVDEISMLEVEFPQETQQLVALVKAWLDDGPGRIEAMRRAIGGRQRFFTKLMDVIYLARQASR